MAQLQAKALTLGYEGRAVLENVSFSVAAGDYLCIVGENGSGKSTLVKTLLGLQPPLRGSVEVGEGLSLREIGYLPQQTAVQKDFPASVWEITLSGCLSRCGARPFYGAQEKRLARENLQRVGMEALSGRCYRELSGGQQQRVLLARALCATRKMLLLDEPAAGLDPRATAELYETIARLNREQRITIVMISHDLSAALRFASHILQLGAAAFFGTAAQYLHSKAGRAFARPEKGERR